MAEKKHIEGRRRPAPTGDARAVLESWLPTGPARVSDLLADLTMLTVNGDWSPLTLGATHLVGEATSAGWADERLVGALAELLGADLRGELPDLSFEALAPEVSVLD